VSKKDIRNENDMTIMSKLKNRDEKDNKDKKKEIKEKERTSLSPEYKTKYNSRKIKYYKTLGKMHVEDVDDSSTDYSESSDDFPTPPRRKDRSEDKYRRR
jgi:hypothetical protein